MKIKVLILSLFSLAVISLVSCNRNDDGGDPTNPEESEMDNIEVPDGFTFETTKEVNVSIKMPSALDFNSYRGRFNIYAGDPENGGKLVYSGGFDINGEFSGVVKVPAKTENLFVSTIAGSKLIPINELTLKGGGVDADFSGDYINDPPAGLDKFANGGKGFDNTSSSEAYDSKNLPNQVDNGDFETNDFGYITWWSVPHPVDGRWYFTTHYAPGEWLNEGNNHFAATPYHNGFFAGGVSQMINASEGDVVTFSGEVKYFGNSGNYRFWPYMIALDANGTALEYFAQNVLYPTDSWESFQIAGTMPPNTVKCQILFWAHDLVMNGSVVFDNAYVTIFNDSDGDGVADSEDDYPNDPTRAYNVYYPNETDWGTLAFEDLWPGKGDYDFNDLVCDYHYKSVLNAQNELVEFFTDYSVRAIGASLENGFGFMLGGDPANIESVTGSHITENYIELNPNGTEQNQTNTVIILFDNAFKMFNAGNYFINTLPDADYVAPDTNQLHVIYNNPVSTDVTGTAPYNPFLIVNKNRGQEVHLAGQEPTDLADQTFFGQWADDSDPAAGKYYQTVNNLPWGLDLPVSFEYPVEKVAICNAYNHFVEWAESAGASYPDWYEDNAGYRNSENIYTPNN